MKKEELRIVFMGTPEFAVASLQRLVEGGYNVVAVVTQPDKPVGRHQQQVQASPVKQYAEAHGLPVLQPVKMKDPVFVEQLAQYEADLQVVVAFRILPEIVWAMPRFGTFNVHAALLPQYRGAAPINWAVINGETETGVTTFFLDKNIDTGRIIMQKHFSILDDADVEYVYNGLMNLGADIATETIDKMLENDGNIDSIAQSNFMQFNEDELLPAPKIFKETCEIDWHLPVKRVYDFVRGLSPYPGTWTTIDENGQRSVLKIFETAKTSETWEGELGSVRTLKGHLFVRCSDGWLELLELQPVGKKRMTARDFLNGMRDRQFKFVSK